MKIELIQEDQYGKPSWYEIRIDDIFVKGSFILSHIRKQYEELKNDPELVKIKREVLESCEIVVPLENDLNEIKTENQ
jgi:hypothetical protein